MKYVTKDINTEGSQGELIGWDSSRRVSLLSNLNISAVQLADHNQILSESSLR